MPLVTKYLPKNPVVVDAGAHIGIDSEFFAKEFPNGVIFSLEPVSSIYNQLITRIAHYKNCKALKIGLADFDGNSSINVSSGDSDASSSLLSPKLHLEVHPNVVFDSSEVIEVQTLETFIHSNDIEIIDLLWLDLQGLEPQVLRKSRDSLSKVRVIHTEVSFIETYKDVELFPEFDKFLKAQNFKLIKLNRDYRDMGNALYINLALV